MPEHVFNPEFRDEFEKTKYPFADNATLASSPTGQTIDIDLFLDAAVYPIGGQERIYLSRVTVASNIVTIAISDVTQTELADVTFHVTAPPDLLQLFDAWNRPAGVLVSDTLRLSRFSAWPNGVHTFRLGQSEFAASVVTPVPTGSVRGVITEDGDLFAGDLYLVGDRGVVLTEQNGDIRVDIVGDPLFVRRLCTPPDAFESGRYITTINGCPPDQYGNFNLTVGDHISATTIVRILPTDLGLEIMAVGDTTTPVR